MEYREYAVSSRLEPQNAIPRGLSTSGIVTLVLEKSSDSVHLESRLYVPYLSPEWSKLCQDPFTATIHLLPGS
ncbi:hypothetical protein AV530_002951 [Patagioenas fasciata monilis]|uniref:Uncharacterized protein n=1 Tax=Patagioenas fasciata monilis TaxID=372326 RepID=A0A1V4KZW0_PATFA|nr:hypothetical protein AV530_002951 [Patagioenas fasciata monilis]